MLTQENDSSYRALGQMTLAMPNDEDDNGDVADQGKEEEWGVRVRVGVCVWGGGGEQING